MNMNYCCAFLGPAKRRLSTLSTITLVKVMSWLSPHPTVIAR